jgi:hypothetical protein
MTSADGHAKLMQALALVDEVHEGLNDQQPDETAASRFAYRMIESGLLLSRAIKELGEQV